MTDKILVKVDENKIAHVVICNKVEGNALDREMVKAMCDAFTAVERDDGINSLIVYGEEGGRNLSGGIKLQWLKELDRVQRDGEMIVEVFHTLHHLSKPTVVVSKGRNAAGGAGLVGAADLTIAEKGSSFAFSTIKVGVVPIPIIEGLIERLGVENAVALASGGNMFTDVQGLQLGFIDVIVAPGQGVAEAVKILSRTEIRDKAAVKAYARAIHKDTELPEVIIKTLPEVEERVDKARELYRAGKYDEFKKFAAEGLYGDCGKAGFTDRVDRVIASIGKK